MPRTQVSISAIHTFLAHLTDFCLDLFIFFHHFLFFIFVGFIFFQNLILTHVKKNKDLPTPLSLSFSKSNTIINLNLHPVLSSYRPLLLRIFLLFFSFHQIVFILYTSTLILNLWLRCNNLILASLGRMLYVHE